MFAKFEPTKIYTALFMLVITIIVLFFHSPFLIFSVLGILFIIGFIEAYKLYVKQTAGIFFISLAVISWLSIYALESMGFIFVVLVVLASIQSYTKKGSIQQAMPFIYPAIPFCFLYFLYIDYSIFALVWLVVIVALTDSFAYFGGRSFGGKFFANKVFCQTSPNKTKEGVLIGVLVSTFISTIVGLGLCGFFSALFISFVVSVASVFGDLYESYLKRRADVKDSGSLFPGHGGVLDRLDGYFFGGIILYFLLNVLKG